MRDAVRQEEAGLAHDHRQELTDMLVYLQNLPETRDLAAQLLVPAVRHRREAVPSKGCADATRANARWKRCS